MRSEEDQKVLDGIQTLASFTCPFCGRNASVGEGPHGSAAFHARPECETFIRCDPAEYLHASYQRMLS